MYILNFDIGMYVCRYFIFFSRLDTKAEIIIGDAVTKLHPNDSYNIHFPFKKVNQFVNIMPKL